MKYEYTKPNKKGNQWLKAKRVTYYFAVLPSPERGKNRMVQCWRFRRTGLEFIGTSHHNSAAWKGGSACAVDIASNVYGHKNNGYDFIDKQGERTEDITMIELINEA